MTLIHYIRLILASYYGRHFQASKQCTDFKPIIDYICLEELPNNARDDYCTSKLTDDVLYHFYTARTRRVLRPARIIKQLAVSKELRDDVIA